MRASGAQMRSGQMPNAQDDISSHMVWIATPSMLVRAASEGFTGDQCC